jgi:pyruvate-ferredoxin/flavodoxin oxidoreductase
MGKTQYEQKLAVDSGYWPLYRYNPTLADEGKNPFILESKAPDGTLQEFLSGENRYAMLEKMSPEASAELRKQIERDYAERYNILKYMAEAEGVQVDAATPVAANTADTGACENTATAEHSRPGDGAPCDDGRAGK